MTMTNYLIKLFFFGGVALWSFGSGFLSAEDQASSYRTPMHLLVSEDGSELYVCETTAKSIAVVGLADQSLVKRIELPANPTGATKSVKPRPP